MKQKILNLIENYLQFLARAKIKRAKPKIIAITGSYGKTLTKEAVFQVLHDHFGSQVGKNWGNMNSTLGLPLSILGLKNYSFGPMFIIDLLKAKWGFLFYRLPKILVLELGIDKPGEMSRLLSVVRPNIAVITGISETHLEGLKNINAIKREKELILKSLVASGVAIISADDENSKDFDIGESVKVINFGKKGQVSYSDLKISILGTTFKLNYDNHSYNINSKLVGRHQIQSLLIAFAASTELGVNINEIILSLEKVYPQKGRMKPLKIKNGVEIIDDSYNSNPKSVEEALKTLSEINHSGRKVAVLGNMNELGEYTKEGHLRIGSMAGSVVDLLIAVGENGHLIAMGVKESKNYKNRIAVFKTTEDLIAKIDTLLHPGDLVLIKGSQNRVRLEKLIKYLLDDEKLAKNILVRQEKKWQKK